MKIRLFVTPKKDSSRQQSALQLIDCGQARKRTQGLPVGFTSEVGWPPFNRFLT
jgi:hypothetical protein